MAHPQHNFTSNFNGSEGHNAELTLNINGTEHKYTPAGNDKEFTVTGAVRINTSLDGSELVERITTVLNGDSLPLLVQQNLDGTEDSYTYVGLQDNEWLFGRVTTTHIDSVAVNTSDGGVRHETLPLASDVAIVAYNDPAVYTKLRTAVALGHLPVLDYQGTYATYVTIDNNILKFATEAADPNVESYAYTVASDNTVTATPRNAGVVRADSADTEPGTLIDKLEVVDSVKPPEDPTILNLEVTTDGQGNRKVAINEDNLRTFADNISDAVNGIMDTLDSMDFDEVPHAYLGSTLFQSSGDPASTGTPINIFSCDSPLVGECFEFEQTTVIDNVPFGYIWIEPGTYLINASVTLQWVGAPRGTFMNKVGLVMGENFDFSQEQELVRSTTRIATIPTRTKLAVNVTYDAGTPVMGFWIKSMQVVKIAGGMSQTNVTHDSTLTGQGSVADPLGVNTQNVAQSTLANNVAPVFIENSTNALAGHLYSWKGKIYVAEEDYNGAWDVSKFKQISVDELLNNLRNILSFYIPDTHVLTSSNTLSNQSYPNYWATYYKVFVPAGAIVKYKNIGQTLDAGFAYIYIIDLDGNDLYKKLGGSGTDNFDVSYMMPDDGYVSICGTPRSTIQISVNCPIGHSFEGAYIRKLESENETFKSNVDTFETGVIRKFDDLENVLQYYTQSVYALTSSNTLSNQSYPELWATYYKLFVPKGTVIRYKNDGSYLVSGFAYIYIIDLENNDLYKKLGSSENTPFDITYTMPEDGYVSLCGTPRLAIQISVSCPLSYNYYDKVVMQQVRNNISEIETEAYLGGEFASVRKFGVVGDSLSVGYMTSSGGIVNSRNIPYSWGQVLARKNGQVCLNFGKSGITTSSWWTDSVCKDLLVLPENQCQAYIVGIGTNDVINDSFPIGSMSDIDWSNYNNNANSFYGHYARILQLILSVAPKAVIFVLTLPYPRADTAKNTAFRTICSDAHLSSNVFLVDLQAEYNDIFKAIGDKYANDWHFTAAGYASIATALGTIISETIRKNSTMNTIKDIGFIPFGSNDVIN